MSTNPPSTADTNLEILGEAYDRDPTSLGGPTLTQKAESQKMEKERASKEESEKKEKDLGKNGKPEPKPAAPAAGQHPQPHKR
jgi:hypothetical protein